jgi:hypothetical protein
MFFANEQRENVREENPGISFGQVGKLLGERWKALTEKQRAPYEAKAAADKKRYEDEKQAYNVSLRLPLETGKAHDNLIINSRLRPTPRRMSLLDRSFAPIHCAEGSRS